MANINRAILSGTLTEAPVMTGNFYGKPFFKSRVFISNKSRIPDIIDVVFSGKEAAALYAGMHIRASGKYTTRVTNAEDGSTNTSLYVMANRFCEYDANDYSQVTMEGMLAAMPEYFLNTSGFHVLRMILSVEKNKRSDFIPVDVMNPDKSLEKLKPGAKLYIKGHINCRQLKGKNGTYKRASLFATSVDRIKKFSDDPAFKSNRIVLTKENDDRFKMIDDLFMGEEG